MLSSDSTENTGRRPACPRGSCQNESLLHPLLHCSIKSIKLTNNVNDDLVNKILIFNILVNFCIIFNLKSHSDQAGDMFPKII